MELFFYDTRLTEGNKTTLIIERTVHYKEERFNNPNALVQMANETISLNVLGEEHCYMIALNVKNTVLGIFLISKGTINQSLVGMREIFMRALFVGATHIILLHNHPSMDCNPSKEDALLTRRLKDAGELLGVPLTDHIIVGGERFFSFKEQEAQI